MLRLSEVKKVPNGWSDLISTTEDHTKLDQKTNNSESMSHDHCKTSDFEFKHPVYKCVKNQESSLNNLRKSSGLTAMQPWIGILFPKLFWPTVRKNCPSDWEKLLKFEAEGWEFAKNLRSLEQFIQTVKGQNNFW